MSDGWFEIAWIGFGKAILHGTKAGGEEVEKVLDDAERIRVNDLLAKHQRETQSLFLELAA